MVIPEENSEKLKKQLTTVIEFELTDIEVKKEIIKSKETIETLWNKGQV